MYERHLRDQATRYRREQYRIWARELVNTYGAIIIRKPDLGTLAQGKNESEEARARRKLVAPYCFWQILKAAAGDSFREIDETKGGKQHERNVRLQERTEPVSVLAADYR
jgi:hypothetical protein